MRPIYHITTQAAWQAAGRLSAPSLATEGFIHCSQAHQVLWVVDRLFSAASVLTLVCIDADALEAPPRFEPPDGGEAATTELFPHVYGPIPTAAVVAVGRLQRGADGRMLWPVHWEPT